MTIDWLPQSVTDREFGAIRIGIALVGFALLAVSLRQRQRGVVGRARRLTRLALAMLGILAMASYYNFFVWSHVGGGHIHELFHYYVASKFARELGYTRIYECAAIADAEDGLPPEVVGVPLRDLATKQIVDPGEVLTHPERCKSHFSPARWASFKQDLTWFRSHMTPDAWSRVRQDHGYNPSPVWTLLGGAVANVTPATDTGMRWVMRLDVVLLASTFAAIAWAFGLEATALAALTFGTSFTARYAWTGDAFLRQMWFSASLIGICLIRRRRGFAGGVLLATAALLRVFPVLFLAGLGCWAVAEAWRAHRFGGQPARIALGVLLATAVLVPWSVHAAGQGAGILREFAANTSTLIRSPAANRVGLRSLLTFRSERPAGTIRHGVRQIGEVDVATQQLETWKVTRRYYLLIVAGVALLFVQGASRAFDWEAAAMGFTLMPILTDPTSYYASFVTAGALLAQRRPRIGLALMVNAVAGWIAYFSFAAMDQQYAACALALCVLCVYVLFEMREPPLADEPCVEPVTA